MRLKYRVALVEAHIALGDWGAAWAHALPALEDALVIDEPACVAYWVSAFLEPCALLGEAHRAEPLLTPKHDEALRQMPQYATEVSIIRARVALLAGDVREAQLRLSQIEAPAAIADPRVRALWGGVQAGITLAQGQPTAAWAALPEPGAMGMNDELRMRTLALRIKLQQQSATLQADTVHAARAELKLPSAHALAALYLHHALAAAQRAALPGAPANALRNCAAHVARLAHSLREHPAQQAAFLRRWS